MAECQRAAPPALRASTKERTSRILKRDGLDDQLPTSEAVNMSTTTTATSAQIVAIPLARDPTVHAMVTNRIATIAALTATEPHP